MPREIALDALDFSEFVRPGDTVTWGQACAEPRCLTERLVAQRDATGRFRAMVGLSLSDTLAGAGGGQIDVLSYGAIGTNGALMKSGALDILPCNYSALPAHFDSGRLPVAVVLVQVSPPGPDGTYSLGLANDYLLPAMRAARVVIAEVNDQVPCTPLDTPLDDALIDVVVPCSRTPIEVPPGTPGAVEDAIAARASERIEDGAVLQYGIGTVPSAILAALGGHRDLGIHSGMITGDVIELVESGAVTNATNRVRPGTCVAALAMGDASLRRFLHLNPAVELHPATTTHGQSHLAAQDRLVALNSALEVDIYGQVSAEMIGDHYIGAVGGQVDFMHAAASHERGLSVIAMPSTSRDGGRSRIVPRLSMPLVTTAKSDVDLVVTEHGAADLRGLTLRERAAALCAVAAPAFRDSLEQACRDAGL